MSIAYQITRIKTAIENAYSACQTMGGTLPATQNSDNLLQCILSIPSAGPGPIPTGTVLHVYDRVDGIATVVGFWIYNNQRYAICVADAQLRTKTQWKTTSSNTDVLPGYSGGNAALNNCIPGTASIQTIVTNNLLPEHPGFNHCYNQINLHIDSNVYEPCLPNCYEANLIATECEQLDMIDPTAIGSQYSLSTFFDGSKGIWTTDQKSGSTQAYRLKGANVTPGASTKTGQYGICPVYEVAVDENGVVI